MIRILHCVAGLGRGGYETFIMNVYRNINRQKVQFDFLYSFDGVFNDEITSLGGRLHKVPFITQVGPFKYRKNICCFLKTHPEYKIIHSHMDKFSGLVMECAKNMKVPIRIAHSHSTKNEGGIIFQIVKNYYGKKIDFNCTHRFACSMPAYQWLFHDTNNAHIIKNGIDLSKFLFEDNRNSNCFTVGNVGRFSKAKNHVFLLKIFKELLLIDNTAKLVLAGTGVLQNKIKQQAKQLQIEERVTFLGDCEDVPYLLSTLDVLCMPSLFEGLGIALIEAQAMGVPCLASDTIPKEVAVCENVEFLSLKTSPKEWAQKLLKYKDCIRKNNDEKIIKSDYDISTTANKLQYFYIENGNI